MKRILIIFILAFLCFGMLNANVSAYDGDQILEIGLFYGNSALPSANLANEIGSGYSLGYFDESRNFVSIAQISNENITVMKDKLMYLGADLSYYDVLPASSNGAIGTNHIESTKSFDGFSDAQKYAKEISKAISISSFPVYINGKYKVRIGSFTTADKANAGVASVTKYEGAAPSVVGASSTCLYGYRYKIH